MEKVLNSMPSNEQKVKAEIALEINANHELADKLKKLYESDKDMLKKYAKLLYAQGCLISGVSVKDPAELSSLIVDLMIK
jgi:molecular chaperone HtpG